jgi:hypothetical protein
MREKMITPGGGEGGEGAEWENVGWMMDECFRTGVDDQITARWG